MGFKIAGAIIIGYILGSIPFSYLIPRLTKQVDVREKGSGNVGALAAWRETNPLFGIIALALDMGKGALSIYAAKWLGLDTAWICAAGFAAVLGHDWPVFLKFRGGKGASVIMGVLLAFEPIPTLIGIGVAVIILVPTSNVRLGIIGLALIPLIAWLLHKPPEQIYYPLGLVVFLVAYTLIGLKGELARKGQREGIIVDKKYNFWQTKK